MSWIGGLADWAEAERFRLNIETMPYQRQLEILDG
jgi:hypothetical protein